MDLIKERTSLEGYDPTLCGNILGSGDAVAVSADGYLKLVLDAQERIAKHGKLVHGLVPLTSEEFSELPSRSKEGHNLTFSTPLAEHATHGFMPRGFSGYNYPGLAEFYRAVLRGEEKKLGEYVSFLMDIGGKAIPDIRAGLGVSYFGIEPYGALMAPLALQAIQPGRIDNSRQPFSDIIAVSLDLSGLIIRAHLEQGRKQ